MKEVDISGITALTKDRETSIRLYRSCQKRHAGNSATWVVQKVIADLERDRGVTSKKVEVRTRSRKRKTEHDYYYFWGIAIARGTWMERHRNWLVVIHFSLLLLTPFAARTVDFEDFSLNKEPLPEPTFRLDPPYLQRQIESGSMLTIQNEVPEPVEVKLTNPETEVTYSFTLPAYPQGRYYLSSEAIPEGCSENAPVRSIPVQPGVYRATMKYTGTTQTESGMWTMVNGWEQFGCYYGIRYDNDDPR